MDEEDGRQGASATQSFRCTSGATPANMTGKRKMCTGVGWVTTVTLVGLMMLVILSLEFCINTGDELDPLDRIDARRYPKRMEVRLRSSRRRLRLRRLLLQRELTEQFPQKPARVLLELRQGRGDSDMDSSSDGQWMSVESASSEGQAGQDGNTNWFNRGPNPDAGDEDGDGDGDTTYDTRMETTPSMPQSTPPTGTGGGGDTGGGGGDSSAPTLPPITETTPVMCNVCDSVLLISESALQELQELFRVFETTSIFQSTTFGQQFSMNPVPRPSCGSVRMTEGNTARIRFAGSSATVSLNSTRPPLVVLTSTHDSSFFEGIGALRSEINTVTGAIGARRVQRTRGGEFELFPPTRLVCRHENCDPSATPASSDSPMPMTADTPATMIWPDPTSAQLNQAANVILCDSSDCRATLPGQPALPQACVDILVEINRNNLVT